MIDLLTAAATILSLYLSLLAGAIDVTQGEWLTLAEAAKLLPGRPRLETLWRWRTTGCRGVKLRSVLIGRTRYVNLEMLAEFAEAVTAAADGKGPPPQTTKQRTAAIDRAKRELTAEGI